MRETKSLNGLNGERSKTRTSKFLVVQTFGPHPSVSRLQVNALHAVFSMSGNEYERYALLLALM